MENSDYLQLRNDLGYSLEQRYREERTAPFPHEDCRKLRQEYPLLTDGLVPSLDSYFSFIAGFSSSASKLTERPRSQLSDAIPKLKRSFFETYPQYLPLAEVLNPGKFEKLSLRLRSADGSRVDLITIMERIINSAPADV